MKPIFVILISIQLAIKCQAQSIPQGIYFGASSGLTSLSKNNEIDSSFFLAKGNNFSSGIGFKKGHFGLGLWGNYLTIDRSNDFKTIAENRINKLVTNPNEWMPTVLQSKTKFTNYSLDFGPEIYVGKYPFYVTLWGRYGMGKTQTGSFNYTRQGMNDSLGSISKLPIFYSMDSSISNNKILNTGANLELFLGKKFSLIAGVSYKVIDAKTSTYLLQDYYGPSNAPTGGIYNLKQSEKNIGLINGFVGFKWWLSKQIIVPKHYKPKKDITNNKNEEPIITKKESEKKDDKLFHCEPILNIENIECTNRKDREGNKFYIFHCVVQTLCSNVNTCMEDKLISVEGYNGTQIKQNNLHSTIMPCTQLLPIQYTATFAGNPSNINLHFNIINTGNGEPTNIQINKTIDLPNCDSTCNMCEKLNWNAVFAGFENSITGDIIPKIDVTNLPANTKNITINLLSLNHTTNSECYIDNATTNIYGTISNSNLGQTKNNELVWDAPNGVPFQKIKFHLDLPPLINLACCKHSGSAVIQVSFTTTDCKKCSKLITINF